ncbi:MAG TPA: PQQ-binding-like beta-propeller repeat protein [Ktedonobacteraceae bacterium]|nr:PQQ-binding-like beta-propeller repeat protein [Ktedonobacteraceae bacterium]
MKKSQWRLARFFGILALIVALLLVAIMRTIQQTAATNNTTTTGLSNAVTTRQQTTTQKRVWGPGSDWTMYLHDIQRTGASSETILSPANIGELEKVWSFKTGGTIASQPIIVDQTVYVGSWDGYEYALNALTGAVKWKTYLGQTIGRSDCNPQKAGVSSSAAVVNGVVYVGGGADYWYALSAKTGAILWKVYTGATGVTGGHYNWSSPLIYNGYAYIGISSMGDCPLVRGELLKVSLATHQIVVYYTVPYGDIGGGIWPSPSVDPKTNTIYIAGCTESKHDQLLAQAVYSLDATTLALKQAWKLPLAEAVEDSDFDTSPTLFTDTKGDQLVASINKNGILYVFQRNSVSNGPIDRVRVAMPGNCPLCEQSSVSSTAFAQNTLFMAGADANLNGVNYRGSVSAWNPATGKFLWQRGEPGPVFGALTYDNGMIFDGEGGTVEVLDAKTGARLWSYQTPADKIFSPASVSHGMVFIGDTDGDIYAFGLPVTPPPAPIRDPGCPTGWVCQNIGNSIFIGTDKTSGANLTIQADGTGHGGTTDQLDLMSRDVSGDARLQAKIVSGVPRNSPAQAGLMMRATSAPDSPDYTVLYTGYGVIVQYRVVPGQGATRDVQLPSAALPLYLEIQRTGDLFQAAYSRDGVNYTLIPGGSVTLVLPTTLLAGLVSASGHNGIPATITYRQFSVGLPRTAPEAAPSSSPCASGWQCGDIGNPALQGSQTPAIGGSWTLQGAGTDISTDWDQFHFVAQRMNGNGSIVARVSSPTMADPWTKAGIMIRQNDEPNAPFYGIFLTPDASGNGIEVLDRLQPRLIVTWVGAITGKGPVYLRITRVDNVFSASISDNGKDWIDIQGSATPITMSNTVLAGLTITSRNPAKLSSATFDHIHIG